MKKKKMILAITVPRMEKGKFTNKLELIEVEVLSIVDTYAMVRRLGCAPFVARSKDLKPLG